MNTENGAGGTAVWAGLVVAMAVGLSLPSAARGQSLAEVARREADRRSMVGSQGRSYTDRDLKPVPPRAPSIAAPKAADGDKTGAASGDKSATASDAAAKAEEAGERSYDDRGEEFWRQRATAIRTALDRARADLQGLDARADSLEGAKAGAEGREREIVVTGQKRAKASLESLEAEWARFEKAAQAANVPASWIR